MKWKLEHSPKKEHGTGLEYVPAFRVTPSRGRRIDINYLSHHYCETPEQAALHKKNAEANAKLIAAAPELLEQLIKVTNAVINGSINSDHIEYTRELIKKATL